ncbi:MAG: hypothetical protein LBS45_07695 [Synergistaceae bacterium]|nr:hypothetical protein [Synergistaceae bacterium]
MARNAAEILRDILSDSAIVKPVVRRDGCQDISLFSGRRRITVLDVPENTIVVNMQTAPPKTGRMFLQEKNARLIGCYVFAGTDERDRLDKFEKTPGGGDFMVFVETNDAPSQQSETERRLRAAVCVMDYCAAVGREFCGVMDLFGGYKRRFVKIKARGRVNRRFNFSRRLAANDSPSNPRMLEGDQIPFRYFAAQRP